MHYYYSILRKDYLYKGIVLYESMKKHDRNFKFFLVCMEEESLDLLKKMNLINLVPISIKEIENFDKRIPELKHQRGEKTYIWTAKASVPLYIFEKYPEVDHVIWLDGDTEFQSDPQPIYEEWGDNSVLLTPEGFTDQYEYLGHMYGFYNTGFMGFKKDETGIAALQYFRSRLQEWKETLEEQSSWNDQHYVNDWLERFPKVVVVKHRGINLTPFIASRINAEQNGFVNMREGIPYIKDTPIVLYHFMALKYYDGNEYDLCNYWMRFHEDTIKILYIPYLQKCQEAFLRIREIDPDFYPYMTIKDKYIGNYFNLDVNTSEPVYNLCTITDESKVIQTLCLYDSISRFNIKFRLWICCTDESSYNILASLNLPEIMLFQPSNLIEYSDNKIQEEYKTKTEILKPRLINLLLWNNYNIESLLYVDCNLYFHQNPQRIFELMKHSSILIIEDFDAEKQDYKISTSAIGFNRDKTSLDCLFNWVNETKKWLQEGVGSREEINHISGWSQRYSKINIIKNPIYLMDDRKLTRVKIKNIKGNIYINKEPLMLYKYELSILDDGAIDSLIKKVSSFSSKYKKPIYLPYSKSLCRVIDLLSKNIRR